MDTAGNILWSKQYLSSMGYQENAVVQTPDSDFVFAMNIFSSGNYPVLCKIDTSGNVLTSTKFNVINSAINNIVSYNNSLDIILGNFYVLNMDVSGSIINWQRQYNNSLQFNSLLSNRCANGDLIYIAGQIAGGFGEGTSRIFRTDSTGNLQWSKNILAWHGATSNSGTNFDVVSQMAIKESIDGNIVGVSLDEGGTLLFSVFDSTGNFLFNRNRLAVGQQHCIKETAAGNYLVGSVFGFQSFSTFSSYPLSASSCDSILTTAISSGADSAIAMSPVTTSPETVTDSNFALTVTSITITPVVYCNPVGMEEIGNTGASNFSVYPNPASSTLHVHINNFQSAQIKITNVLGEEVLNKIIYDNDNIIDLSGIKEGIYFTVITDNNSRVDSRKLIVLKK
jgi:hypothetical protein